MSNSRSCHVLESIDSKATDAGYARVKSWVDIEYNGIIRAEAYDRAGKRVKEFKVDSFRKVDGLLSVDGVLVQEGTDIDSKRLCPLGIERVLGVSTIEIRSRAARARSRAR